jgi:hypothetical protein
MSNLILRQFNGRSIRQREDGFISLTDMCQATGKLFGDWNRLKTTKEYLKALQDKNYGNSHSSPIEIQEGNLGEKGGTWGDRRVALRLAQWISPLFALQVDEWIEELMLKGRVSVALEPQARQLPPQLSIYQKIEALRGTPYEDDPIIKSLIVQRIAEDMTGQVQGFSKDTPIVLTVRASQLGVSSSLIGTGSQLGKYVKASGFQPLGKSQHGKYEVNVYPSSKALDNAILGFFDASELEAAA